jgi:uncharacterized protein YbaP (TraB family)
MTRFWLGLAAALAVATPALAKPAVWIVRDKDSEMVLFGSMHLLPPGVDWRPAALNDAVAHADDIWFEVLPGPGGEYSRQAWTVGTLPPGQSLFKLLPPADSRRLVAFADAHHIDKQMLDRLKPWLASSVISQASGARAGAILQEGVESTLARAAPASAVQRGLDTPAQLVAANDDAPMSEQIDDLVETLRDGEQGKGAKIVQEALRAWTAGDLKALTKLAREDSARRPISNRLITTDRNARWAKTLDARLKGKGRTVVVVGAAHLLGPGNLIGRLRALGYSVTGP